MNIGLIAHDSKKTLMQNFCIAYRGILSKHNLFATGTTGRLIEEVTNLSVHKYLAGPLGGKQQLGAQIAQNDIDALIISSCNISESSAYLNLAEQKHLPIFSLDEKLANWTALQFVHDVRAELGLELVHLIL